ncbi:MAG: ATPase/protein kinase [Ignavibacteria bacterium GWB2_35_12]|nr:MAG: ATPase/protein kinase [Ignavibacteria bacterium GWB2_35_12]OGU96320.1 MAG: ATPase/protein kinase [Ignavibacteria bacterium RIFOXYA2_FULL_35_10]OGV24646.1 MAG: ATPase/protein kinase [Ignavibacteria bacterium RIFOXYC2_FULL_35_21]
MQKKQKRASHKPEWASGGKSEGFTTQVMDGIKDNTKKSKSKKNIKTKKITTDDFVIGVLEDNRTVLAQAITLIESNSVKHIEKAQELLGKILHKTGKSIRIGITGAPGVGKSTFIESFGTYLCDNGHKVAVLAIDPSSSRSRGSILGDKTRMENLSRNPNAFIRPSPSGGTLGGVTRKTRESIMLCEAAGFDVIIVETIGVGQSEITVRSMVDFYLLLILPGGGDELQGLKKGAVELADAVAINKADGDNIKSAYLTKEQYKQAVHYLLPATEGWETQVFTCSGLTDQGIEQLWNMIIEFEKKTKKLGVFELRRKEQTLDWVYAMVEESLKNRFYGNSKVEKKRIEIDKKLLDGKITPTIAVNELMKMYFE